MAAPGTTWPRGTGRVMMIASTRQIMPTGTLAQGPASHPARGRTIRSSSRSVGRIPPTIVDRILPTLRRLERIVRPRAGWLAGPWARMPVGIICLVLAIIITLPVPLGHVVPGAAISVLALGLIERDGIAIALGIVTAVVGLLVVTFASAGILTAARLWQG